MMRDGAFFSPWRHCQTALCSLSTGRIWAWCFLASGMTISPAVTSASLLASATVLPALMAESSGISPEEPEEAATTVSTSQWAAISSSPMNS